MSSKDKHSDDHTCEQQSFITRLAVDDPSALKTSPWRDHLDACPVCRTVSSALDQSLAVFKHLESTFSTPNHADAGWERFATTLATHPRHRSRGALLRLPATAAAGVMLAVLVGSMMWPVQETLGPQPPRAVTLKPDERLHLQRVLRQSLKESQPATQVAITGSNTTPATTRVLNKSNITTGQTAETPIASKPTESRQRVIPRFRVPSGRERMLVDSQLLAPIGKNATGRAPIVLFRTLRQMRSRDDSVRVGSRPLIPVQTAGNPINGSPSTSTSLSLSPQ